MFVRFTHGWPGRVCVAWHQLCSDKMRLHFPGARTQEEAWIASRLLERREIWGLFGLEPHTTSPRTPPPRNSDFRGERNVRCQMWRDAAACCHQPNISLISSKNRAVLCQQMLASLHMSLFRIIMGAFGSLFIDQPAP
jgi:hypothetical protein